MFENSSEGILLTDADGTLITGVNPVMTITGYTEVLRTGTPPAAFCTDHVGRATNMQMMSQAAK